MSLMPVNLNLKGKHVVVIGGGKVAVRKVRKVLSYKAKVTIISPDLSEEMMELLDHQPVHWICSVYKKNLLEGAFLIIAATNNPEVNLKIYNDRQPYQLINIVDQPDLSDFHMTSTLQRGKLSIAVSTGGASPILAKKIVNQLSDQYGREYEEYVEFLFQARKNILENISDPTKRQQFLKELVDEKNKSKELRNQWFIERMQYYRN